MFISILSSVRAGKVFNQFNHKWHVLFSMSDEIWCLSLLDLPHDLILARAKTFLPTNPCQVPLMYHSRNFLYKSSHNDRLPDLMLGEGRTDERKNTPHRPHKKYGELKFILEGTSFAILFFCFFLQKIYKRNPFTIGWTWAHILAKKNAMHSPYCRVKSTIGWIKWLRQNLVGTYGSSVRFPKIKSLIVEYEPFLVN